MEDAASQIEVALGPIDVWVNAAMASVFSPVHELQAEEVRRVAAVTYLGSVNGILAALRRMRPRDAGTIVQVGSALVYRAIPLQASYCGSKFAIRGFVDSLRCELLHEQSGVRITTVHMPALNTPQFGSVRSRLPFHPQPVPPIYQPELAAEAIVWAAGHPRREYWIGYPTVGAILVNHIVPGVLDRYLARTNIKAQRSDMQSRPGAPTISRNPSQVRKVSTASSTSRRRAEASRADSACTASSPSKPPQLLSRLWPAGAPEPTRLPHSSPHEARSLASGAQRS